MTLLQSVFSMWLSVTSVSLSANTQPDFVICFDYGCKSTQAVTLDASQWRNIGKIFEPSAQSAFEEKQMIRQAIARMEYYTGMVVGTSADLGGNYNGDDAISHQQDCIDESTNTLQYLSALQQRGWLKWHRVEGKQRRIVWLFTHWTAVIRELHNDQLFAVDSWYRDNGEPPYLQPLAEWKHKQDFPNSLNPDLPLHMSQQ